MEQRPDPTRNRKPFPKKAQNALLIGFGIFVSITVFIAVMVA